MTSINAARAENQQMVNMDIEAIARIEAATKTLNVTKNKGYDDIIISESKSFSGSKKEISQKKDNNVMQKEEKWPQQWHEKTEKAIILPATEVNKRYSDQSAGRKPTDIRASKRSRSKKKYKRRKGCCGCCSIS
uniref:Diacylglycerol kinase, putative n=1 Tax=Brugia malayi TaxID=6279 RepID=A0A912H3H5_BRUMA